VVGDGVQAQAAIGGAGTPASGAIDDGAPFLLLSLSLGFRHHLTGGVAFAPYLRGSFGAAAMGIDSPDEGAPSRDLKGMTGIFGAGLRLAPAPRFHLSLELCHGVINYRDASVILENVYTGTRIDKTGRVTRLQFGAHVLL